MSKTWLSVIAAAILVTISAALFVARRQALGVEVDGPRGWTVTLVVDGTLRSKYASITTARALNFRQQHVSEETFKGDRNLREPVRKKKTDPGQRTQLWRRQTVVDAAPVKFELKYTFQCSLQGRPTPAMEKLTKDLDAAPKEGTLLRSTSSIQTKDALIIQTASEYAGDETSPVEKTRALFHFVSSLSSEEKPNAKMTALGCLKNGGGGALAKSRLLIALCRSQGIQSRLLTGLALKEAEVEKEHHWVEAWVDDAWLPMCPAFAYFGEENFPENYLVLSVDNSQLVSARGADMNYRFEAFAESGKAPDPRPSAYKSFWRKVSFYSLHASEHQPVEFLLLLPLAALIVSFIRTVIGIVTFGVFAPALIGLAFLDLQSLPLGLPIFAGIVLVGWGIRHLLENFHLLQVPRVSAMLTLIVIFLLLIIISANAFGVTTTRYVSMFPLVILTFLVERFWTIEAEDSAATSFKTLLGTLFVSVVVSLSLSPNEVSRWMFRYPETLGVVLAAQLLIGRYTGYRLTELYRFGDLIKEETPPGGQHGLALALASAEGEGHSGHQQPERGLHPGPEPAPPVPARGLQESDGLALPQDRRPDA
jgi:transglutaminase-like putative cysteine protease